MSDDLRIELVFNNLPDLSERAAARASQVIRKTALNVEQYAKRSMRSPKHGRLYRRRGGKIHRASAPGEPPAIDTSKLINATHSIQKGRHEWWVVPETEYAWYLEALMNRKFLQPAVEAMRPAFEAAMMQVVYGG